jgi:hypothetical protein
MAWLKNDFHFHPFPRGFREFNFVNNVRLLCDVSEQENILHTRVLCLFSIVTAEKTLCGVKLNDKFLLVKPKNSKPKMTFSDSNGGRKTRRRERCEEQKTL